MLCKDTVMGMTRWSADCEKITSVHTSDKRLVSKTHKELNNEQTTQFKNRQMVGTDTSPNQLYRWWVHVWKSGARRMLSGDFRWKQQREVTAPPLAGPGPKHWRQQQWRGWGRAVVLLLGRGGCGTRSSWLPGIYPNRVKAYVQPESCPPVLTAALLRCLQCVNGYNWCTCETEYDQEHRQRHMGDPALRRHGGA